MRQNRIPAKGRRAPLAVLVSVLLVVVGLASPSVADDDPTLEATTPEVTAELVPAESDPEVIAETPDEVSADDQAPDQDPAAQPEATAAAPAAQAAAAQPAAAQPAAAQPAAATVGRATDLVLTVLQDGTPNEDGSFDADDAPGHDSSDKNGIVRTQDTVVYRWGFSVATAGDVLLTHTLPEGMSWVVAESTTACAEGAGAVSSDGRTLSCTRAGLSTGSSTYQVRARVDYGANGQVMSSVLGSTGAADSEPVSVTVSAAPRFDTATSLAVVGYQELNGVPGLSANLYTYLYQPVDANRGNRGNEALADGFSFQIDPTDMGANALLGNVCSTNGGGWFHNNINGTTQTAENSVPNAGTWTCSQAVAGGPITVTNTGAITDGRTYPTKTTTGAANDASRAYVTAALVRVWIPQTDYPEARALQLQVREFDPVSVSGQSNYGDGYTTGQGPSAAFLGNVNGSRFTFSTTAQANLSMIRVYSGTGGAPDWTVPLADGASAVQAGDTPMFPGQTLRFGGYVGEKSPTGQPATNMGLCATWDETTMVTDGTVDSPTVPLTTVEYAHLDMTTDAERKATDCGVAGDGASGWYTSVDDVPGGAETVNAVRYVWASVVDQRNPYTAVTLTRTDAPLATGTAMPVFFQFRTDATASIKSQYVPATQANQAGLGTRALAAGAQTSVSIDWDAAYSDPGVVRTVTVQPSVSAAFDSVVAENVAVSVTIPATVSMIGNSWPTHFAPTSVNNADGSVTYTFRYGDLPANVAAEELTFRVGVSSRIDMPATIRLTAVVTSDSDPRTAANRTDTSDLVINSPASFQATKSADSAYAVQGVPVTYTVSWYNGLDSTAGVGKIVDVLPFSGDVRGTTGLSGLTLDAVTVDADMGVQLQYTTDSAAAVEAAVTADRSGDTGITWTSIAAGLTPPSHTTALRFVTDDIDPGMLGTAEITVTPGAVTGSAVVFNDLSGTVELVAQPLANAAEVELASGSVSLSGTVYGDTDYSWAMDGAETGLGGVTVTATGYRFGPNGIDDGGSGDDIVVTGADAPSTTTAADGSFSIDGLAPGSWTVSATPLSGYSLGQTASAVPLQPTDSATDQMLGLVPAIDRPVLTDDTARVSAGDSIDLDVLANDTADASAVITAVGTPSSGTVTVAADELSLSYLADQPGTYTFSYTVTDKARQSESATVTVTVVPLPTAANATFTVGQGTTPLALTFTGDGTTLTTSAATAVVNGSAVDYTPTAGFSGADSFTFTVTDSMGKTATATVTLTVLRAPDLSDDSTWTTVGTAVRVPVTANDAFVGTGTRSITDPAHCAVTLDGDDAVYTPVSGWTGTDSFTYTVTDEVGQTDTATVTVIVVEAITAQADTARTGMETSTTIDVLANDVATDGTITGTTTPANGAVEVNADDTITYTPNTSWSGVDTFTYTVTDAAGQSATANVTVTVVARPTGDDATVRTGLDTAIDVPMTAVGDALTLAVTAQGAHGVAVVAGSTVTYTPASGYVGTDQVELTWTDSVGQTVTVTLDVEVVDAPVANDDAAITTEGVAVTVDVLGNDQGDTIAVTDLRQPMFGTAVLESDGRITYTPAASFSGKDSVVYTITDAIGQTAEATVTVSVYAAPRPADLTGITGVGMELVLNPAAASPRAETLLLAPWTVTAVGSSPDGTAVLNPDGTVTITPAAGFVGELVFGYDVLDDLGQTGSGTMTVRVVALTAEDFAISTAFDTAVTVDAVAHASGEQVTVATLGAPAHGTAVIGADGRVVYTPTAGYAGPDVFTVTYVDVLGQTTTATVTVTVEAEVVAPGCTDCDDDTTTAPPTEQQQSGFRSGVLAVTGGGLGWNSLLIALGVIVAGWWLIGMIRRRPTED